MVKWQQPTNPHLTKSGSIVPICNCFLVTNVNYLKHSMAILPAAVRSLWTDFYERNRNDGGPFQALFETNTATLAAKTARNKASIPRLTEAIAGSGNGNMMLVPGTGGMVQVIHHGFATEVDGEFALVFVHGNVDEFATFKVLNRESAVEPIARVLEPEDGVDDVGPPRAEARQAPSFLSLIEAENARDFGELLPEGNDVLTDLPNHFLIHPKVFALTMGARSVESKYLAFEIIARIIHHEEEELDYLDEDEPDEGQDYEGLLAFLWAVANGLLTEVRLNDIPETTAMNNMVRKVRAKVSGQEMATRRGNQPTRSPDWGAIGAGDVEDEGLSIDEAPRASGIDETHRASIEMMASSSQAMAALMNRMQEGNEIDRSRKEAERSLLKTMGPTQRELFTSLCTTRMTRPPRMSEFMTGLTMSKTPQKAINLLLSETRDWEGTFSVGGFHRMLSHGFMSHEANRTHPGGFTLFMFHPKTVEIGTGGGKGGNNSNALLREYLGMEIEEETLEYYAKQGYFIPSNPNDMRIQLQTALNTLELLTCDQSIATKGLAYVLAPARWARIVTNMNDRFKSEPEFGTKFCYTLDRHLQLFFDKMTRWDDVETDGDQNYLVGKAEDLIERIEDGRGLNIVLPTVLKGKGSGMTSPDNKRSAASKPAAESPSPTKKKKAPQEESTSTGSKSHANPELVPGWVLPAGISFNELFLKNKPGAKGWPSLFDCRIPIKSNKAQTAPMCLKFQALGTCKKSCLLAHVTATAMSDQDRSRVQELFNEAYTT